MKVVVIGNGVAGMEAALALAEQAKGVALTVISEESDHFFSRPALMWVASGQLRYQDTEPLERDAYARLGIRRVRARAVGVDVERHRVRMAGDRDDIPYDRLLIACGSRARPAPWTGAELRGVGSFVTLQDLAWYQAELGCAALPGGPPRPEAHLGGTTSDSPYVPRPAAAAARGRGAAAVAVIGGGLIGIEAVELALARRLEAHFFVREEWFWPMALDARESRWICQRLTEHGAQLHLASELVALEGDAAGNVRLVRTRTTEHACDAVVVAIGVVPNTAWLSESGLERDAAGGLVVDDRLQTSAPDVFAAGDCASVRWPDGTRRPEPLWYAARDQGRVAARALLGAPATYLRERIYNSAKLMDIEYTTVGSIRGDSRGTWEWSFEETGAVRSTIRIALEGPRVVGMNLLGRRWDHALLLDWIAEHRSLQWVLERLPCAAFDTELVPPLVIPEAARRKGPAPAKGPE